MAGRLPGRPFDVRLRATGWLAVLTPLHVGGLGHDPEVDLPVAVDGLRRLYVPGTSLAGVCRAWMVGAHKREPDDLRQLWGYIVEQDDDSQAGPSRQSQQTAQSPRSPQSPLAVQNGDDAGRGDEGRASRVFVRDGLICSEPDVSKTFDVTQLAARTSVGIDRHTGAAARGILFTRAVVPAGTFVRFELDVESPEPDAARDRARLVRILDALAAGEVPLGAASGRGLGCIRLDGACVAEHDLRSRAGLLTLLRKRPTDLDVSKLTGTGTGELGGADGLDGLAGLTPRRRLRVNIDWVPAAPVMVRADRAGIAVDTVPFAENDAAGKLRLVLPGSSVKGALRAHAERLLRTVYGASAPCPPGKNAADDATTFHRQLAGDVVGGDVVDGAAPGGTGTGLDGPAGEDQTSLAGGTRASTDRGGGTGTNRDPLLLSKALFGAAPSRPAPPPVRTRVVLVPRSTRNPIEEKDDTPSDTEDGSGDAGAKPPDAAPVFGAGALRVADCHSTIALELQAWRQLGLATELPGDHRAKLAELGLEQADHVAIDRWTGGAADKLLFTVLEPWNVTWQPIRLDVDVTRLHRVAEDDQDDQDDKGNNKGNKEAEDLPNRALALLMLVLRDLAAGRLPLGQGTNRGFGDLADVVVTIDGDGVEGGPVSLDDYLASPAGRADVENAWTRAWRADNQEAT